MLTSKIMLIILGYKGLLLKKKKKGFYFLSFGLPDNLWVWWGSEMNNKPSLEIVNDKVVTHTSSSDPKPWSVCMVREGSSMRTTIEGWRWEATVA